MVKIPDNVSDDQAILVSDIFPTGWFGADLADIHEGSTVAVFGCGPVGQFVIASARLMGAGRILAVDHIEDRLDMAQRQGAEIVNFDREDLVKTILELTDGIGTDRAIDAVGIDAKHPHHGPAASISERAGNAMDSVANALKGNGNGKAVQRHQWKPGDAPDQVLDWAIGALAKAGTLAIIGVYPPTQRQFPSGQAMNRNLTIKMGNCNHRKYIPHLLDLVAGDVIDPTKILTKVEPMKNAIEAYQAFDARQSGWLKVELKPAAT